MIQLDNSPALMAISRSEKRSDGELISLQGQNRIMTSPRTPFAMQGQNQIMTSPCTPFAISPV